MHETYLQTWGAVFTNSLQSMWMGIIGYLPRIIVGLLIIALGWIVATLIGRAITHLIHHLKIENMLKGMRVEEAVRSTGMAFSIGGFIGGLVKWFFIVVFLVTAFEIMGLQQITEFLRVNVLGSLLPNLIIAVLILLVAVVIGDAMQKIVTAATKTAGFRSAHFLGSVTKWAIWIFAIFSAMKHLNIQLVDAVFQSIMLALAIGFGLAFGLGGQDAASRFIAKAQHDVSEKA